jgi:hypothetical protein
MGMFDAIGSAASAAATASNKKIEEDKILAKRASVANNTPKIKIGSTGTSIPKTGVSDIDKFMGASTSIFNKDYGKKITEAPRASQTEAEKLALASAKSAGGITPETQQLLNMATTQAGTASAISPEQQQVLALRQAGLGGFNAEENTALRESMLQNIARAEQGALRQLKGAQAGAGIRGGLAGAQSGDILNQMAAERAAGERELFLKNIAQKDAALGAFEGSARGIQGEAFGRGQQALGTALGAQTGAEGQAFTQGQQAIGNLASIGGGIQQQALGAQQFNVGQADKTIEQQFAAALGLSGLEQSKEFQDLMKEYYKNGALPALGIGGGTGGGLTSDTSTGMGLAGAQWGLGR